MKENRSLLKLILLTPLTAGIYGIWFWSKYAADMNIVCSGDGKKTSGILARILLTVLTAGIYELVWVYKVGDRISENCQTRGIENNTTGGKLLMWNIFGVLLFGVGPFVAQYKMIKGLNALNASYNRGTYGASKAASGAVNVNIYSGAGAVA